MTAHQLRDALRHVDFPASKRELIEAAQAAGAADDVIAALQAIPPEEYASRQEVASSVPLDPAEERGLTEAERAQQARKSRHHGGQPVSQYEREVRRPVVDEELDE